MVRFSATATILALAMTVAAVPAPMPALPDPAGEQNVGNGNNGQFIGGQCLSSNDCALGTACCATFGSIGLCSGLGAQFQAGKTGCGFGDGSSATPAIPDDTSSDNNGSGSGSGSNTGTVTVSPGSAGSQNVGLGNGSQFITGQCLSDADCASGCCATGGACAAAAVVNSPQDARECGFIGTLARA
ncbi:hypothetical protein GQX73_g4402 [Xylaria multiplex]|uniref:Biotrophy-associated secreted protein 2 n=1 Tax=Xylaria multiplex TaxID=323545 RepID=A0A7C8ISI3_9PEZI|nr:hypothetical protein GQX73_g4402 [Xylaria multiplex]